MGFNCGIVGLPNVGKSTLFNALTETAAAQAANYPFCTIEPNVGRVGVPDPRLTRLAEIGRSQKVVPTSLEFVDIAGLVRGASKGEGLGNQFLANIREVDAIVHVLRCFEDGDVTHVEGNVDPVRDAETVETELMLADLDSLEKRAAGLTKRARGGDKEAQAQMTLIEPIIAALTAGRPARTAVPKGEEAAAARLQLLTTKPVLYVCNVEESAAGSVTGSGNAHAERVFAMAKAAGARAVVVSAAIEAEISQMPAAWTITRGTRAPQAAGVIHGDFERGFIACECTAFDDYVALGGEQGAKEAGKLRIEGKEYVVKDGDILLFRFNV